MVHVATNDSFAVLLYGTPSSVKERLKTPLSGLREYRPGTESAPGVAIWRCTLVSTVAEGARRFLRSHLAMKATGSSERLLTAASSASATNACNL